MARVYAEDFFSIPTRTKKHKSNCNRKKKQASSSRRQSIQFWKPEHQLYSIIFEQFDSFEEANLAFMAIAEKNRRWCRDEYPSVSCFVGLSKTQGRGAKRLAEVNGRGHPNNVIEGKRNDPHIHMILYGDKSATYARKFIRKYNTKVGWTAALSKKMDCMSYISYVYNQSELIRTSGTFNFTPYCVPYNKDLFPNEEDRMCWNNH